MAPGPSSPASAGGEAILNALEVRGFTVVSKLAGSPNCSIFCVSTQGDPSGEICAAKVVNLAGLDAQGRAAAQQEVSFLKGIPGHPNLIAHRDSFMEEGSTGISSGVRVGGVDIKTGGGGPYLFLLMSYAEDGDLRLAMKDRKQAQQTVPELVVLSWLRQTIAGLRHMHAHGVIHRDLKSSNIFLSGGRRVARIGDFGISKVLESVSFAQTGVGTPAYMAPETMTEMRYDFQADIWALGCILFELCALDPPFLAESLADIFVMVTGDAEPDWNRIAGFSQELQGLAKRLLQKDPSARPTAAALLEEPLVGGGPEPTEEMWSNVAPSTRSQQPSEFAVP